MDRLGRTNIVIGTPGRVLQHMDENPNFDCSRVQIFGTFFINFSENKFDNFIVFSIGWSWSLLGFGLWKAIECCDWKFAKKSSNFVIFCDTNEVSLKLNRACSLVNLLYDIYSTFYVMHLSMYVWFLFRSVRDLARLSLKDPLYVSVHENSQFSTPEQLKQVGVYLKFQFFLIT